MDCAITFFLSTYLPNIIATLVGTVLGFLGAYLIYFLTTRRQRREKREFEKNRWEYFQYLLTNSIERTKINIGLLGKKIEEIAENNFEIPPIEQKTNGDLRRLLHDIDLEGVFHLYKKIFKEDNQKEIFYKVISQLDYFELKMDLLKSAFERAMNNDFNRRVDFNSSFIKAANEVGDIKDVFGRFGRKNDDVQVDEIIKDYKSREQENLTNYEYHYQHLLLPIHDILQKIGLTTQDVLGKVIFDFETAIFKYNLVIKGNENFKDELEKDKMELESNLKEIEKLIEPILKSDGYQQ